MRIIEGSPGSSGNACNARRRLRQRSLVQHHSVDEQVVRRVPLRLHDPVPLRRFLLSALSLHHDQGTTSVLMFGHIADDLFLSFVWVPYSCSLGRSVFCARQALARVSVCFTHRLHSCSCRGERYNPERCRLFSLDPSKPEPVWRVGRVVSIFRIASQAKHLTGFAEIF